MTAENLSPTPRNPEKKAPKNRKARTALLSIGSNSVLIIMKLITGLALASVSIISEAIHSSMDLLAALIAFFSVRSSDKAPDRDHPYGHGKVENISGVIEALLILLASGLIVSEAVKKILHPEPVEGIGIGFVIMLISALVNFIVSRRLYKVAKEEASIALEADALHLKADVITSLGVALGLLVIFVGGFFGLELSFLDPWIAIAVAIFIIKEGLEMLINAFRPLVDHGLPEDEVKIIQETLAQVRELGGDFHDLRTRSSGKIRHIDCHLSLPAHLTVAQSHDICDRLEQSILEHLPHAVTVLHVEPLEEGVRQP